MTYSDIWEGRAKIRSQANGTLDGIGTPIAHYAPPKDGPFRCDHCVHFKKPGECNHPAVIVDPGVRGKVAPDGCCNFYHP